MTEEIKTEEAKDIYPMLSEESIDKLNNIITNLNITKNTNLILDDLFVKYPKEPISAFITALNVAKAISRSCPPELREKILSLVDSMRTGILVNWKVVDEQEKIIQEMKNEKENLNQENSGTSVIPFKKEQ